ncbi:uncharacterized protein N7515_000646 [Penicillium bovifimosum]|uniref:Uncharacterized protein n=1 Tax=Penicillium bovifimosum TaxID=126998 RepID=A0A9W9LB98_9EURO|nr:uncharacterized protein N7515_000646 [Penicillium bovifimosum]KAJ5146082.1 hypothetical protein N7515_000646 [Penicillium bovifimosum]
MLDLEMGSTELTDDARIGFGDADFIEMREGTSIYTLTIAAALSGWCAAGDSEVTQFGQEGTTNNAANDQPQ